jgi:carboxyl-terminal processing protease
MKKPISIALLAVLFVINLAALSPRTLGLYNSVYARLNVLADVRHELVTGYVEQPDQDAMIESAIRGMISSLKDPYTTYLSPEDLDSFDRMTTGRFSGIGAEVTFDQTLRRLKIVSPLEDSPAWNAGVLAGDVVLEINEEDTLDMSINDAVERLLGEPGTDVTIKVRHETGDEVSITITRAQINIQTVRGFERNEQQHWDFMLDKKNKIAFIRITQFADSTADDLKNAVRTVVDAGARGLILDLRFNGGGLLNSAVEISDAFLPVGQTIVSVRGRAVPEEVYQSQTEPLLGDIPMVVLANEASASAAEIVTGALHDNDRARFIGTRTFGKGSVQQVRGLTGGAGALKMTNAYYYIPSGRKIHRVPDAEDWGVTPADGFYVPMTAEQIETMLKTRREGDIVRHNNGANHHDTLTPQWITDHMADLQLAAGLTAILGELDAGAWPSVGASGADELVRQSKLDALLRRRGLLQEGLNDVQQQIAKLEAGEDIDAAEDVAVDAEAHTEEPAEAVSP